LRIRFFITVALTVAVTLSVVVLTGRALANLSSQSNPFPTPTTVVVPNFSDPVAMVSYGRNVWVANWNSNSITEVDGASGAIVRKLSGLNYELGNFGPTGLAVYHNNLWVSSGNATSLTDINSITGTLIRVIKDPSYGFNTQFGSMAIVGSNLWVLNTNTITVINATTGALVRIIAGPQYKIDPQPNGVLTQAGGVVWVANSASSLEEINASTGALIRIIDNPSYRFSNIQSLAAYKNSLWVANYDNSTVTQVNATTGALVQVIQGSGPINSNIVWKALKGMLHVNCISMPDALMVLDGDLWIVNYNYNDALITELNATTGALMRVAKGSSYGVNNDLLITSWQGYIWDANGKDFISEIDPSTGKLIQEVH
jgi:hypothetical protein